MSQSQSQSQSQNNWVGEIYSQDLNTEGVDPLSFFATSALEAASQIDIDGLGTSAQSQHKRRKKDTNPGDTNSKKKRKHIEL